MKKLLAAAVIGAAVAAPSAFAQTYSVYCVNGKTKIDTRNVDQMKSAHGSKTYRLSEEKYLTDAQKFEKEMNGVCPKK